METRYISLEPLAFDEGIYRENLMKDGVKQREYSIIIIYNASCRSISSLSECTCSVYTPGCKTFGNLKHLIVLSYICIHFLFIPLTLFVQFIDLGVNLKTCIMLCGEYHILSAQTQLQIQFTKPFPWVIGFPFSPLSYCSPISTHTVNVLCCEVAAFSSFDMIVLEQTNGEKAVGERIGQTG